MDFLPTWHSEVNPMVPLTVPTFRYLSYSAGSEQNRSSVPVWAASTSVRQEDGSGLGAGRNGEKQPDDGRAGRFWRGFRERSGSARTQPSG